MPTSEESKAQGVTERLLAALAWLAEHETARFFPDSVADELDELSARGLVLEPEWAFGVVSISDAGRAVREQRGKE